MGINNQKWGDFIAEKVDCVHYWYKTITIHGTNQILNIPQCNMNKMDLGACPSDCEFMRVSVYLF